MLTLIWCHGGCFSGGNASYDLELRDYLANHGVKVISVEFNKSGWEEALIDIIQTAVLCGSDTYIFGGVSSGGMLAHQAANILHKPAFLLCPVLKPAERYTSLEENFKTMQLNFFHSVDNMRKCERNVKEPNNARQVIFGSSDSRAPIQAITSWLDGPHHLGIHTLPGGHELCKNPPLQLCLQCVQTLGEIVHDDNTRVQLP